MFNAYCIKCKKSSVVEKEDSTCLECGEVLKILGTKLNITASNGAFKKHY